MIDGIAGDSGEPEDIAKAGRNGRYESTEVARVDGVDR